MYKKINFRDRIDKKPDSYFVDDKEVTITKNDAEVAQFGTNLNATNLNHMEEGILQNSKDIEELKKGNLEVEQIKYEELKKNIDEKQLKVGSKYLLIDYATKYEQPTSKIIKTGEIEPLLLTASSSNTLEPVAYSPRYPQDIIFYDFNNNQCEDKKTSRNGFITKRIDTINHNSVPGDFRNLLWVRYLPDEKQYYLKNELTDYEVWIEGKAKLNVLYKSENKILIAKREEVPQNATDSTVFEIVFDDITNESCALFIKDKTKIYKDIKIKIGKKLERKTFGENCYNNTFEGSKELYNNVFDKDCNNNTFGKGCNNNTFSKMFYHNTFGNECYDNLFLKNCSRNNFQSGFNNNIFHTGGFCNTFNNSCYHNIFLKECYSNFFGSYFTDNILGGNSCSNFFGNDCTNNHFGNYFQRNTFLNGNKFNTFGDNVVNNFVQNLNSKNLSLKKWKNVTFTQDTNNNNYYCHYLEDGKSIYTQVP